VNKEGCRVLSGADVKLDWISLTAPSAAFASLLVITKEVRRGPYQKGFEHSHVRDSLRCAEWSCRRFFGALTASKEWGKDVESWAISGDGVMQAEPSWRGVQPCRCSRLDVAFDFLAATWRPEDLRAGVPDEYKTRWIEDGKRGRAGQTLYVGSRSSDCRVVAYEKGKEQGYTDGAMAAWQRIEVQYRHGTAAGAWASWCEDKDAGDVIVFARGRIRRMLGVQIEGTTTWGTWTEGRKPELLLGVKALVAQYGGMVAFLVGAGQLDGVVAACVRRGRKSRLQRFRNRQRQKDLEALGGDLVPFLENEG
jgi:hypothetical protein